MNSPASPVFAAGTLQLFGPVTCTDCGNLDLNLGAAGGTVATAILQAPIPPSDYSQALVGNPIVVLVYSSAAGGTWSAYVWIPMTNTFKQVAHGKATLQQLENMKETAEFINKLVEAIKENTSDMSTAGNGGGPSWGYSGPTPGNGSTPFDGVPVYVDWQGGLVKVGPLCDAHGNCSSY